MTRLFSVITLTGAASALTPKLNFYPSTIKAKVNCDSPFVDSTYSFVDPAPTKTDCTNLCKTALLDQQMNAVDPNVRVLPALIDDAASGCSFPAVYGGDEKAGLCSYKWSDKDGYLVSATGNNIFLKQNVTNAGLITSGNNLDTTTGWTVFMASTGDCGSASSSSIYGDGLAVTAAKNADGTSMTLSLTEFYQKNYNVALYSNENFTYYVVPPAGVTLDVNYASLAHTEEANFNQVGLAKKCAVPSTGDVDDCNKCLALDPKCHFCRTLAMYSDIGAIVQGQCGVSADLCLSAMNPFVVPIADGCTLPTGIPDWMTGAGAKTMAVSVVAVVLLGVGMLF